MHTPQLSWSVRMRHALVVLAMLAAVAGPVVVAAAVLGASPAAASGPGVTTPMVVTGDSHTCALTAGGAVYCWGYNFGGELGDGTTVTRTSPVPVTGLSSGVVAIGAGGSHTCALMAGGQLKCWGANTFGEIGDGTAVTRKTPVAVSLGVGVAVAAIGLGRRNTCAVTTGGAVLCWGDNGNGQIGDGTNTSRYTPTPVSGLSSGARAVISTSSGSCAVLITGAAKCWGYAAAGGLGNGSSSGSSRVPVDVLGLSNASSITAGPFNFCVVTTVAGVRCWGSNQSNIFGFPNAGNALQPVDVPALSAGVSVLSDSEMGNWACAVVNGGAKCWGASASGQLGIGILAINQSTPANVTGLNAGVATISAGGEHACAVLVTGEVRCWGLNASGQLGNGTVTTSTVPVTVPGLNLYAPPTITGNATPAPNGAGWNSSPVTVTFACSSDIVASCSSPAVLSTDGSGQSATGTVTDLAGRTASVTVGSISIDQTAPMVVGAPSTAANANGWYRGPVQIGWMCDDPLSGLASACPSASTISGEGAARTATATATDRAGNVATASSPAVSIDVTAPLTAASAVPEWSNTNVTVNLIANDNLSGVDHTWFTADGAPAAQSGSSVTFSTEGVHSLTYWSVDRAGNAEAPKTVAVRIDGTSPTISDAETPAANGNGWNNSPVTVHFTCVDVLSGISSCTTDQTVSTDGEAQIVSGDAIDRAGNTAHDPVSVNLDRVAPTIVGTASPSAPWVNTPVTVSFACADALSGVAVCPPTTMLSGEGANQSVVGTAVDAAGNSAASTVAGINIDLTPPTISGSVVDPSTGVAVAPNVAGWYRTAVIVRWTCADSLAGVPAGGCPADTPVNLDGSSTVAASVSDAAGNIATATALVRLDRGAPQIYGAATPSPNGNGWNNTDVTVSFTCYDPVSNIAAGGCPSPMVLGEGAAQSVTGSALDVADNPASVTVSGVNVDETPPTLIGTATTPPNGNGWYRGPVTIGWTCSDGGVAPSGIDGACPPDATISGEGSTQVVSATVADRAGNDTSAGSAPVRIDTTAPLTEASSVPTWSGHAVNVDLVATDNLSGVDSTSFTIAPEGAPAGPAQSGSTVSFTTEGVYELSFWSVDNAGNVEAPTSLTVRIDLSAPTIADAVTPAPNGAGWNNTAPTVTFSCADSLSGVASCSAPVTVSVDGGAQAVAGTAVDNAGNTATDIATVNLDRLAPTVTASTSAPTGTWVNAPVVVTFACADGLSGVLVCPSAASVSSDGAGQSILATATDAADNVATIEVGGISIDTVPPTITASIIDPDTLLATGPNSVGWFRHPVLVHWTCADGLSGIVPAGARACPGDTTVSTDGSTTVTGTVADIAGNAATSSVTVLVDLTAPAIQPVIDPAPKGNGWNNSDVNVGFTCTDTVSGIAEAGGCTATTTLHEGANQTVVGSAVDAAGNGATTSTTAINVDLTPPTLVGTPTMAPNAAGWHRTATIIHWTCDDELSGLAAGACPSDVALSTEGPGQTVQGSVDDRAGNTGVAVSAAVSIDLTPPVTTATAPVVLGNVATLTLDATDNLSGVAMTSYVVDGQPAQAATTVTVSGVGGHTVRFWSTDAAGNVEAEQTLTVTIAPAASPPTISHALAPVANADGWNNTPVKVTFSCVAGTAALASCTAPQSVAGEGASQLVTGTAVDSFGTTATDVAVVSIDTTAPTIAATLSGTPSNGWYSSAVTITFACTDELSGVGPQGCPKPITVTSASVHSIVATATDVAGNRRTITIPHPKVDLVAPVITGTITTAPNSNGWFRTAVSVHWACTDVGSGLAPGACPHNTVLTGEGDDLSASATVVDRAGNATSATVSGIHIDRTSPSISSSSTSNGAWNNRDVTIHFTCTDGLSGIDVCPGDTTLTAEGAHQSVVGTATDLAGNHANLRSAPVSIDRTAPIVSVTGVVSGGVYTLGEATPGCSSSDAVSGLAARATLTVTGATPNGVGLITAVCAAEDRAGNRAQASVTYSVRYHFEGFFGLVANPPIVNGVRPAEVVAVLFTLTNSEGRALARPSAVTSIAVQAVTDVAQADPALASPAVLVRGTAVSYLCTPKQMSFRWVAPTASGLFVLFVTLDDGTVHLAYFT